MKRAKKDQTTSGTSRCNQTHTHKCWESDTTTACHKRDSGDSAPHKHSAHHRWTTFSWWNQCFHFFPSPSPPVSRSAWNRHNSIPKHKANKTLLFMQSSHFSLTTCWLRISKLLLCLTKNFSLRIHSFSLSLTRTLFIHDHVRQRFHRSSSSRRIS